MCSVENLRCFERLFWKIEKWTFINVQNSKVKILYAKFLKCDHN